MDNTTVETIGAGIIRHLITTAAGALVANGTIQSSQSQQFIGAAMFFVGIAWSWWQKSGQAEVQDMLKKMTAKKTVAAAVVTAQALPTGAAVTPTPLPNSPGMRPGGGIG
jgi:hypothetical protein